MWLYLFDREICQDQSYKKYDPDGTKHLLATARDLSILSKLFFDAMARRDDVTLRAIARAVKNYERNPARGNPLHIQILHIKEMVEQSGGTMTVKLLATLVNTARFGKIPTTEPDEALRAQVRRAAKRLGFPLAKPGRPKTIQNKG